MPGRLRGPTYSRYNLQLMFENIVGNEPMKSLLRRLRAEGRTPGAALFAGPDGVGKRLFALEIARSFVCRNDDGPGCGTCPPCERAVRFKLPDPDDKDEFARVMFGDHLDVGLVVPYKRFILVDAIRDLETQARFRPFEGEARTFIIDNADRMNDASSNALLKTLEEPADTTRLILISSRPDSLLATIRSRCQTFRFSPVPVHDIEHLLVEKHAFDRKEAALAARLSGGSVGRALSIDVKKFTERRERMLAAISNALSGAGVAPLIQISDEMNESKNKETFEDDLNVLESLVHDIWSVRVAGPGTHVLNADVDDKISQLAQRADSDELISWENSIRLLRDRMAVNINRKMAADALFVQMAA